MQDTKVFFSLGICPGYLKTPSGLEFTPREIEIISCLLNARGTSRIASFLSISPKTVINHIRNIMLKLECNSREGIIDFLEKSHKSSLFRKYYAHLTLRVAFEKSLKTIPIPKQTVSSCVKIIYPAKYEHHKRLSALLETHFKAVGLKVSREEQEEEKISSHVPAQHNIEGYKIYISSKQEEVAAQQISLEKCFPIPPEQELKNILFLILEKDDAAKTPQGRKNFTYIDITKEETYYLSFFDVFQKISPQINIQKVISAFKSQCAYIKELSEDEISSTDSPVKKKEQKKFLFSYASRPWLFFQKPYFLIVTFFSLSIGGYILYKYVEPQGAPFFSSFFFPSGTPLLKHSEVIQYKNKKEMETVAFLEIEGIRKKEFVPQHTFSNWNIPRQDIVFVGREDLLKNISSTLNSNQKIENSQPLAITACAGLGGVGKTQLALHYIHHTKHSYTFKAWFPGEDIENLYTHYIQFAKSLGYKEEKPTREHVIAYVNKWFADNPGWLLIYDNVNDYKEIKPFLPERGGHVLLTTRQRNWPLSIKTLLIDIMTEKEGLELLSSFVPHMINKEGIKAKELAKSLGYLPLALAQAGAYMKQNQVCITDYLKLYKLHELEFLDDNTLQENLNINPVQIAWNITLDKINCGRKKENLVATELLTVAAYLSPDKISRDTLLQWLRKAHPDLEKPELILNKSLGLLWNYSMINFNNDFVSVHRLVQAVLRYKHLAPSHETHRSKLTELWYTMLLEAINDEYSKKTAVLEDEERKKFLLIHMQTLLLHCQNKPWKEKGFLSALGEVFHNIGFTYHYLMSNSKKGKPHYELSLAIKEKLYGKNSLELSQLLVHFGNAYGALGDPQQQQCFLKRALSITEQKCGKNDKRLVEIIEGLGAAYWAAGQSREAVPILERGLKIAKNYENDLIIKIADLKYFLGNSYNVLGDYEKQEKFLQESLNVYKNYYRDHFQTAFAFTSLGVAYRHLGFPKKSKEYLEKAIYIQKKSFGENYVEVGESLRHLGYAYLDLGEPLQAKALIERAIVILENYYGKDHIYVIRALDFLADAYLNLQAPEKARDILTHNLKIKELAYGKKHIYLAKTLQSLGTAYMHLGKFESSKTCLMRALNLSENYYGSKHIDTAHVYISIAQMYSLQGNRHLSYKFLTKALLIARRYNHLLEYVCLETFSDISLQAMEAHHHGRQYEKSRAEKEKALFFLKKARDVVIKHLPGDAAHIARIQSKIASLSN